MFARLLRPSVRSRASITVEVFGWPIMLEGSLMLLSPASAASILHLPTLVEQAENYFRLVGLLAGGIGMLYVVSGRMNAEGFIFASLLDRPLVPIVMAVVSELNSMAARTGVCNSGFRQFSLDPVHLAQRAEIVIIEEFFRARTFVLT